MGRKITDLENYIEEAIKNIRADRDITSTLLTKIFIEINSANNAEAHKDLGLIASKYVETLQRSNEQLVKLISLCQKNKTQSNVLSAEDKQNLFDMIQEVGENGEF